MLTYLCLAPSKGTLVFYCRPVSDTTERGVFPGSTLDTGFLILTNRTPLLLEKDLSKTSREMNPLGINMLLINLGKLI